MAPVCIDLGLGGFGAKGVTNDDLYFPGGRKALDDGYSGPRACVVRGKKDDLMWFAVASLCAITYRRLGAKGSYLPL